MTGKFIREVEVGARAITPNKTLAPSDMFDILQEAATIHSDVLGYDMDYFTKEQKGWTILNWRAEFGRLPKWRERLTVETWPTAGRGLVANRNFRVLDGSGEAIMKVISQWCYFDKVRRRPVKINPEMVEAYTSGIEPILPVGKISVETPDEGRKISESRLIVRRSHTDTNFHVNNVSYIKWAEDDLPDNIFYNGVIKNIYINYRKEAKAGDEINSSVYEADKNIFTCFIKSNEGNTFAEMIMKYEK